MEKIDENKFQKTGIEGLENILPKGIPTGHVVLIKGQAGSGKTTFSMQWLFEGYKKFDEPGIYVAATEPVTKVIKNLKPMEFCENSALYSEYLHFTDFRSMREITGFVAKEESSGRSSASSREEVRCEDIDRCLDSFKETMKELGARRLVLDSITAIGYYLGSEKMLRYFIFRLGEILEEMGCTAFIISERTNKSLFNIEDFIADGILTLENIQGEQSMVRRMNIDKMRGTNYRTGKISFEIDSSGIVLYPKIPVNRHFAKTDFEKKKKTGVEGFDEMMDGGFSEGHMVLISGNTGTGKSTLGMQFLVEGMENGEPAVFINLEEPTAQIKKTAEFHTWDFNKYQNEDMLEFVTPDLIDTYPNKLLHQTLEAVDRIGAKRVLLDSISSLPSANVTKDKLREHLLQMTSSFKEKGVTCLMTYLTSEMFTGSQYTVLGDTTSSDLRLSSLVDGIVLLRYVEKEDEVGKAINVLKMRGCDHSRKIRKLEIEKEGAKVK